MPPATEHAFVAAQVMGEDVVPKVAAYVYPLATSPRREADTRVSGKFAISFDIKSAVPIAALESPSHGGDFVFAKHSEQYQQASWR